ncbi:mitochondrial chaperone BCS1 [Phialemonium atrogriseum]|uniref:Mitochondrial chaperone BCS1 n=1 Tax=Phialemonium atrogriseum TaxID=1093897 RepID=A0AAJ0C7Z2_9PEZI|nr:mitochondrial chaperone BCS1 [Phialemonium atrogriseum]KAK1771833.1 mitochondrial chaperone BCS1 [Phialemonium atrogriseum]
MDSCQSTGVPVQSPGGFSVPAIPQLALLDFFFPGLSAISGSLAKYLHVDLSVYFTLALLFGGSTFIWRYFTESFWGLVEEHFMSTVDIRTDDELYNYVMAWVSAQRFAQGARRFIANVNLDSRFCYVPCDSDDEDEDSSKKQPLSYTPTFGDHYFWYKGRLLIFRRTQNREQGSPVLASAREEISICSIGRGTWVLKALLHEAREAYMKKDEDKTLIYRGQTRSGGMDPSWQRCMARTSRPLSTVILDEKVKQELIRDVKDYLDPATRRWYSNRGIPYRRGYLLYGPPGTGKSSLSLALAGHFKMRIYIVSLSSVTTGEESLASLFADLPRRCVVLLEDIDTAGLSHTREEAPKDVGKDAETPKDETPTPKGETAASSGGSGRLSLSGLLNILDGVASQEGRVLVMTTNHLEKLDKALIRPGRVDMVVKFDRADCVMTAAIFRAIFAPLEVDDKAAATARAASDDEEEAGGPEKQKHEVGKPAGTAGAKDEVVARVDGLAGRFAAVIPPHEFSPAEIQGYLLKHKRHPEAAVDGAERWVIEMRKERSGKEGKLKQVGTKHGEGSERKPEESKKKKKKQQRRSKEDGNATDSSSAQSDSEAGGSTKIEDETASKESDPAEAQDGSSETSVSQVEESKHGGDSGYGTP